MMKFFLCALFLGTVIATTNRGIASPEKTNAISQEEIEAISESNIPEENSPFIIEREEARQAAREAATNPIYRSPLLTPRHSMQQQIKNFAAHFLTIAKVTPNTAAPLPLEIFVEPISFSVTDTAELTVSLKVTNTKKEMLFLEFPTNQRIEIKVKEKNGKIVARWSEDRSFDPISGVVTINPKESIFYTEKISTSGLKNGTTYLLEASLVGHPDYTCTQSITPQET